MRAIAFVGVLSFVLLSTAPMALADGTNLVWSTFLGGSGEDKSRGIVVDDTGNAFIIGSTTSMNFPSTAGAYSTDHNGGTYDVFVSKLNPTGTDLEYSTYIGGTDRDWGAAIAIDNSAYSYLIGTTESDDFPVTQGAYDTTYNPGGPGGRDAFVTKLTASGDGLVYSSFLGGNSDDEGYGISLDNSGNALLVGVTISSNFPTTPGAFDDTLDGYSDAFVAKLSPEGNTLVYSTFLGGSSADYGNGIAVDNFGQAYVTGQTHSINFPITAGAFDDSLDGSSDVFVSKLSFAGDDLSYSTYLGGSGNEGGLHWMGIAVDLAGNAYVIGQTYSANFPLTPAAFDSTLDGSNDAFVVKLNATGDDLDYATYLGGSNNEDGHAIAVDCSGYAYATGETWSDDFPTTIGAFDDSLEGELDAFMINLNLTGSELEYGTLIGGSNSDCGYGIAVNTARFVYVTGETKSYDFPTTSGAFDNTYNHDWDVFATKFLVAQGMIVELDIKPQSCPNPLNIPRKGVIPVAILGTEDFDVTTVDPSTCLLEGVPPVMWALADVSTPLYPREDVCDCHELGADGLMDLTLKYNGPAVAAALDSVVDREMRVLTLRGLLTDGCTPIQGQDCVRIQVRKLDTNKRHQLADGGFDEVVVDQGPNPFNLVTEITFSLPERTKVSLAIYNVLGQKVRTLVHEVKDAGTHSVLWNSRNDQGSLMASGIYFYRFETERFTKIMKMVLIK